MDLSMGNLYDINKQLVKANEKPLNHLALAAKQELIEGFFCNNVTKYAMLLCHEQRDFTIFHVHATSMSDHFAAREALGCCTDRGEVLSIEWADEKQTAIEIWIMIEGEVYCYYLFPYDNAVIECN